MLPAFDWGFARLILRASRRRRCKRHTRSRRTPAGIFRDHRLFGSGDRRDQRVAGGVFDSRSRRRAAQAHRQPIRTPRLMNCARVKPPKNRSSLARRNSTANRSTASRPMTRAATLPATWGRPNARTPIRQMTRAARRLVELGRMHGHQLVTRHRGRNVDVEARPQRGRGGRWQPHRKLHTPRQLGRNAVVVAHQKAADPADGVAECQRDGATIETRADGDRPPSESQHRSEKAEQKAAVPDQARAREQEAPVLVEHRVVQLGAHHTTDACPDQHLAPPPPDRRRLRCGSSGRAASRRPRRRAPA